MCRSSFTITIAAEPEISKMCFGIFHVLTVLTILEMKVKTLNEEERQAELLEVRGACLIISLHAKCTLMEINSYNYVEERIPMFGQTIKQITSIKFQPQSFYSQVYSEQVWSHVPLRPFFG